MPDFYLNYLTKVFDKRINVYYLVYNKTLPFFDISIRAHSIHYTFCQISPCLQLTYQKENKKGINKMAKKLIDWTVDGNSLNMNRYNSDKEADVVTEHTFDISKIHTNFSEKTEVEKHHIIYGMKQLLADCGASLKGDLPGKVEAAKNLWEVWESGEKYPKRANATGGAENKRILSAVKTASKVVSLEGLMLKKITFPDTFTKEDQKKLNEFMKLAAKK
jgi:hypothetical protein